jgi:hypothetical protein
LHCPHEREGLIYRPGGIVIAHRVAAIIRHAPNFFSPVQRAAKFDRHSTGLDQVQTEGSNQSAVGSGNFRFDGAPCANNAAQAALNMA